MRKVIDFTPIATPPVKRIEVVQLGLSTGKVVRVNTDKNDRDWQNAVSDVKLGVNPKFWARIIRFIRRK